MPMTTEEARRFLQSVFDRLFDPAASAEDVGAFFSPDYVQDVDGRRLDRGEFLNHVRVLKSTLDSATVTFKEIAADGTTIADIHVVEARKKNGDRVRVKVMAFYTLENGKIRRIEELTYLLEGRAEDRDLGFRVLH
jgi:ketosteroid isomerase-like protein